jgi:hypothetical protein
MSRTQVSTQRSTRASTRAATRACAAGGINILVADPTHLHVHDSSCTYGHLVCDGFPAVCRNSRCGDCHHVKVNLGNKFLAAIADKDAHMIGHYLFIMQSLMADETPLFD